MKKPPPIYLTSEELAQSLRVDATTVTRWANSGQVPGAVKFGGHWRFRRSKVLEWIRKREAARACDYEHQEDQ